MNRSKVRKINEIEKEIAEYEDLIKNKEVELNAHVTDFNKLNDLYMEKIELESQLDRLLEKWIELNE